MGTNVRLALRREPLLALVNTCVYFLSMGRSRVFSGLQEVHANAVLALFLCSQLLLMELGFIWCPTVTRHHFLVAFAHTHIETVSTGPAGGLTCEHQKQFNKKK